MVFRPIPPVSPVRTSAPAPAHAPWALRASALLAIVLLLAMPGSAWATLCCNTTTLACMVQTGGACPIGWVAVSGTVCDVNSCTPQWSPGAWSTCSASCGPGTQSRPVSCAIGTTVVADVVCINGGAGTKPPSMQACNLGGCPVWSTGPWSTCSTTCGPGTQTRAVVCMVDSTVVADGVCIAGGAGPKPPTAQACNPGSCPVWSTGPWSTCSTACGPGTQTRTVVCMVDAAAVPDSVCASGGAGIKPPNVQSCNLGDCHGACCNRHTGGCLVLSPTDCAAFGGAFAGGSTVCSPATCTACPADFNGVGGVTIDDLFLYINAYFEGC